MSKLSETETSNAFGLKRLGARIAARRRGLLLAFLAAAALAVALLAGPATRAVERAWEEARLWWDVSHILELVGDSEALPFHERVDRVRRFVNLNSQHLIDEEFWTYNHDEPRVVRMLLERARGAGYEPHLECSSRSRVMAEILEGIGIRSRLVHIYRSGPEFPSHTYLEVFNPASQSWEIQDPDYDLFYLDAAGEGRLSTEMMLSRPLQSLQPCLEPDNCGWSVLSRERKKAKTLLNYFDVAAIRDRKGMILLVNEDRLDPDQAQPVKGRRVTFCEHDPELCSGAIVRVDGD